MTLNIQSKLEASINDFNEKRQLVEQNQAQLQDLNTSLIRISGVIEMLQELLVEQQKEENTTSKGKSK